MKKRVLCGLLMVILISITGCNDNAIETKELLEDLDYYVNIIRQAHGDPFRKISEQDFKRSVEELKQQMQAWKKGKISIIKYYYYLQELAALMQDGHTSIDFPFQSWDISEPVFPFRLKVIDRKIYVIEKWGKDSVPSFSQILEINKIPIETLFKRSSKLYNTSLDHSKSLLFENNFGHTLSTYHGLKPPWTVTFKCDNQVKTAAVKGTTSKEYFARWQESYNNQYRAYSITVDGQELPVLEIPGYSNGNEEDYHRFIDEFFEKHKESGHLVIDVRCNDGGSGYWGYYLLDYLADAPYLIKKSFDFKVSEHLRNSIYADKAGKKLSDAENGEYLTVQSNLMWTPHTDENKFRGKVFLLISEKTFSAGAVTAAIFKFNKMGIIIGQETSGRERLCSDPVTIELPHTKLKASIPLAIYTLPGDNPDRGVIPDIRINYSIKDYENGVDKEIQKVREFIINGS
ncbi:S41 family peptidase [Planctomycetota bacterium]